MSYMTVTFFTFHILYFHISYFQFTSPLLAVMQFLSASNFQPPSPFLYIYYVNFLNTYIYVNWDGYFWNAQYIYLCKLRLTVLSNFSKLHLICFLFETLWYILLYTQLIQSILAICKMNADCFCFCMVSYNILYAQSFIHYVNFYVNLVVRSLQQRWVWGEKKKKMMKMENKYFGE